MYNLKVTLITISILLISSDAWAFHRFGGGAAAGSCPLDGGGWVVCALYGLVCIGLTVLFFWLLFRITRALERIADSKDKE